MTKPVPAGKHSIRLRALFAAALGIALAGGVTAPSAGATRPLHRSCQQVTPDGPCGMNLAAAWKRFTTGDPRVLISYIEGGINWHIEQAKGLVDNVYVNWHETPVPCTGNPCKTVYGKHFSDYDLNNDGVVNAKDWTKDPRVTDANSNGYIDPEDLIAAFSDGTDHDHNGYVNDISGWDFYDNQNDPATPDTTYDHSDGQMGVLLHECPKCMILPVKAGAEALDRTDDLAKAWLFSADAGASVVTSVTGELGYSRFMREAIQYLERKGVVMVEASNDFDSTDHQGGMYWPYVIPGNGVVATQDGSKWTRSDYTSWGTHAMFSAATNGGTTSESTPTTAGVFGLLLSWGLKAARQGLIDGPLSGPEAVQVLQATARRVTDPTLPWPGSPGPWNLQYGYGIPRVFDAMKAVTAGDIPPAAAIDSPDWYRTFDPTGSSPVKVTGTIDAPRASGFTWILQAGLGGQPGKKGLFQIGTGSGQGPFSGKLGTLDLSSIPKRFWSAPFGLSKTKALETTEQYAVTLLLTVTDAAGRVAVDRRAINVVHDRSWLAGFPRWMGTGGEGQPALVDLQGTGRLDMVFGDSSGFIHALDPSTGREIKGWPQVTRPVSVLRSHQAVDPGFEPVVADVAVGDLNHTGHPSVVAASIDGRVYVFDAQGNLQAGWPKTLDLGVKRLPIPRPVLQYTRLPVQGAVAPPVLYDLTGKGKLDVIQAGWDGHIHVWRPDGSDVPGWPVKVKMPAGFTPDPGYVLVNDQKLDTPPAVAFLEGRDQPPDLVMRPQYTETVGGGLQPYPFGFVFAYHADGSRIQGWPVKMPGTLEYYGSAQEFITEGNAAPAAADVTGTGLGPDDIAVGPVFSPPYLIDGGGHIVSIYQAGGSDPPIAFTTSGAFGKVGGVMSFVQAETGSASLAQALLQPNSGAAINEYEVAYPAAGGGARPGFPAIRQGIDFLGEPIVTDVTGDGQGSVVDGGDSNAMHAYTSVGGLAAGFPKWTSGWNLFSPAAGDLLGTGKTDLVSLTREGYVFAWDTPGLASANTEWWRGQHDEWNSGNYEAQTRPARRPVISPASLPSPEGPRCCRRGR